MAASTIFPPFITSTKIADVLHHGEIVRDEKISQSEFLLQILQQIDDLRLHRNIERTDRLVADDELRIHRERPGNPHPLALAAAELMRIAVEMIFREPDLVE